MNKFLVYYYQNNIEVMRVSEIIATTQQSAENKFEQMYHNCRIIKIEEVNNES